MPKPLNELETTRAKRALLRAVVRHEAFEDLPLHEVYDVLASAVFLLNNKRISNDKEMFDRLESMTTRGLEFARRETYEVQASLLSNSK